MSRKRQEPASGQDRQPDVSRRRFIAATGLWTGAAAVGALDGARHGQAAPDDDGAQRAGRFLAQIPHEPPFSFVYNGTPSATLLARWPRTYRHAALDAGRTVHTYTWSDARSGLVVRCTAVEYHDFPTVEWTLHVRNEGAHDAPPLSDVLALDTTLRRGGGGEFVVHTANGSAAVPDDYAPWDLPLPPRSFTLFTCVGGRPMSGYFRLEPHLVRAGFPYFNVDWGGQGAIVAIGWPGQWAAEMTRDAGTALRLQAGMSCRDGRLLQAGDHIRDAELLDLVLRRGEEVRTPRIVVQFWQGGDWIDAQNTWRRWMIAHNMPRPGGRPPAPMCPTGNISGAFTGMVGATAADEVRTIAATVAEHIAVSSGGVADHWWMDAGWYQVPPEATDWSWTGTWTPDPARYPRGLRPVTDRARAAGMKSIVWHEPERVRPGTWLYTHHPEWLLGPGPDGDARLLDLGNPRAWRWVVDHFDGLIRQGGIDVFRNDFNIDPLEYWNMADAPGRRGITQTRYVTGFLAFWDELLRRHPNLLIDCCASGGRRNDLESMRRGVPLWRSDDFGDPVGQQGQTYGISFWLPYHGSGMPPTDAYALRSAMYPSYMVFLGMLADPAPTKALAKRMMREWRGIAGDLLGDYYPLTPYNLDGAAWIAWQFHRPDPGQGVVQAFRRDASPHAVMRFPLRGLAGTATYEVKNADEPAATRVSGHDLMATGLVVRLKDAPGAATITYRRIASA